jgi:hypothetical protein
MTSESHFVLFKKTLSLCSKHGKEVHSIVGCHRMSADQWIILSSQNLRLQREQNRKPPQS